MTAPEPPDETVVSSGRSRLGLFVAVPVFVVMALFVWVLASGDPATDRVTETPLLDQVAPALAGDTLTTATYDIDRHRGEFVLVNFFATWCTPCVREHPELVRFADAHERIGDASVVSVIYGDQASNARAFFAEQGGEWPVVLDPDGRIALDYGVAGVPESFLVGPDGVVLAKLVGGVTQRGLDELLARFQAGPS